MLKSYYKSRDKEKREREREGVDTCESYERREKSAHSSSLFPYFQLDAMILRLTTELRLLLNMSPCCLHIAIPLRYRTQVAYTES